MKTLRRYLRVEIIQATGFVLFALVALFSFFEFVNQLDDVGRAGYQLRHVFIYVLLSLPTRTYELMPIGALIGTIYALSKLASNSEFTIMRVSGMSTRRLAWAVLSVGLVLLLVTYALGEFIAPPAERLARQSKLVATGSTLAQQFRSGIWVRDALKGPDGRIERLRFINVARVQPDISVEGWRVFEFDRDFRLRSISRAAEGRFVDERGQHGWRLKDVVETRLPVVDPTDMAPSPLRTEIVHDPERLWISDLRPEIFGVLLVQPERMAALDLAQYIQHLAENHEQTDRYEIALWNKVFYPLAVLVMMVLALPFAYLHVRAGSVSLKIFTGVMIGVLFYALNKLFAHLGLLNTWPPVVIAALPSMVVLTVALGALYWIERR
ncbi:MAG TPA: LPS export ABC transporter permease LptG [Burkholderiaceae bacterium]|nr:LPS export ABC transporter permease LptG [Burkholderiaceae bacterium]